MMTLYAIRNLHCSGCAARMEDAFARLPGVLAASIDLDAGKLRLEGEAVDVDTLNRIADNIEFGTRLELVTPPPSSQVAAAADNTEGDAGHGEEHDERHMVLRLGVCAVLLASGLLWSDQLATALPFAGAAMLVKLFFFGVPYLLCGAGVLKKGFQRLLRGDFFNEFTLMGGATLAAIGLGELPEAVGVMLFYCAGEAVQERAAGSSRRSIKALLAAKPTVAHLVEGTLVRDVDPREVQPGARLQVLPGEKIPLDGIVRTGTAHVDTSPLTGEPVPVSVEPGSPVYAGAISLDGALELECTAPYAMSSVARILEMVESAVARKAPTERFITRFARIYTPVVVLLAVLVALFPPLFGLGSFQEWSYKALVLLVISCPCALVISIPLGYFGGIGAASRRGILVKGGYVLDALRGVRVVAFDKTGTLTRGVFELSALHPAPGVSEEELLAWAALAESRSTHPLARSILRAAEAAGIALPDLREAGCPTPESMTVREIPGKGLLAESVGLRLLAGNAALLRDEQIPLPEDLTLADGAAVVHIARQLHGETRYLGALSAADEVRPESAASIDALHGLGVKTVAMLTGDRPESAARIAQQLNLDLVRAGLLPQDKASALADLGDRESTLFVGDGINDAPVLASAGVSVAMGGLGSEAAIEIADVVILDDSPAKVPELIHLARRTRFIVWQNIALALGVKGLFVALGIVGLSGLWEAVFADVGVALLAVLNASRTMRPAPIR